MELSPYKLLKEAVKAVPATRYAVGIAGIASVVAIIAGIIKDYRVAVFGTLIILVLMFILLVFSSIATKRSKKSLHLPAMVLTWAFVIMSIMVSTLLATSFFADWPQPIEEYFPNNSFPETKKNLASKRDIEITGIVTWRNQPVIDIKVYVPNSNFQKRTDSKGQFTGILEVQEDDKEFQLKVFDPDAIYNSYWVTVIIDTLHKRRFEIPLDKREAKKQATK